MSADLLLRHCAAIRASLEQTRVSVELIASQVAGLEAYIKAVTDVPTARLEQPVHCRGIAACGLIDDDAREARASFAHPRAWVCVGCRALSSNGATLDP